jgi:hypothetical protein
VAKRPPVLLALCVLLLLAVPPVVLQAAIVVTEKYVGFTSVATSSYTTNVGGTGPLTATTGTVPFSLPAGSLLYCAVVWTTGSTPGTVSLTYDGDTMTPSATTTYNTTDGVSAHYVIGPRASSHVQITPSGSPNGIGLACYEVAGVDTGSPVIQTKALALGSTSSHTLTMDSPRTPNSVLFHWLGIDASPTFNSVEYSGVGTSLDYGTPSTRGKMHWDIGGSDITPLITTNTSPPSGNYAVEFAQASAGVGTKPQGLMLGVGEF